MNILTLNKIAACGTARFGAGYAVGSDVTEPAGVMVRSASMLEMEMPASLLAIARAGAGVNNIPLVPCAEKGIVVFNTPGANANAVKELVLAGLLLASRKIAPAIEWAKGLKGQGAEVGKLVEKGKSAFAGPEILGKKLGVIGLGAIGVLVANAAEALGMDVYGYDPFLSVRSAWGVDASVHCVASLDEIFAACDYITIHVPLTPDTKEMINAASVAKMKDGVRILNFARGDLVHTGDIKQALADGKVACYVTDFPNDELLCTDNVVAIPHLGASTPESEDNCAVMAADELKDYLENGNILHSVNYPDLVAPRAAARRICVLHKEDAAVVPAVSAVVKAAAVTSRAKKGFAYTVLDVEQIPDGAADAIAAIDGVLRVRCL
ncbi:MAG: 3-phosphoglycerate dehydrogenase [Clostridia bacterium]|nr:3-phosphoglycerate dehydrogenase [Clostridia bacterium]